LLYIEKSANFPVTFVYGDGTSGGFLAGTGTISGKIPSPWGGCAHRNTKKHYFGNSGGMGLFTWNSTAAALDGSLLIQYAATYVDGPISGAGRVSSVRDCAIAFEADTTTASVMFMTGLTKNDLRRIAPVSSSGVLSTIAFDYTACSNYFGCGITLVLRETPEGYVTLIWSTIARSRSSFANVTKSQLVNEGVAGSATAFTWTNYSLVADTGFNYGLVALPNGTLITLMSGLIFAFAVHDYQYANISSYAVASPTPAPTNSAGASLSFGGGFIGALFFLALTL
jgi:hypothetical protein